jgi:hypothetical protein
MAVGSAAVLVALLLTDPLSGVVTANWILNTARFVFAVSMAFFGYRAVTDYPEADGQMLHTIAGRSPVGAGLALVARALVIIAMALLFNAVAEAQTLPTNAYQHMSALKLSRLSIGQH